MEGGQIQNQGCTDEQPLRFAGYEEEVQSPECMDKGAEWIDAGGQTTGLMKVFSDGSAIWRGWKIIGLFKKFMQESVGRLWKRWINTMKDCLRKNGLDIRQARFVRGMQGGIAWEMNP